MKKIFLWILMPYMGAFASTLSLDECLLLAQSSSKKIESCKADVDLSIAAKHEALSYLLPHIQLDGRLELKNSERDYSVFTDFGSSFSAKTVGVTANLLLFDFFSTWNMYRAGQLGVVASEKNLEKARILLDEEVKVSYFRCLETQKAIAVIEESIQQLNQQHQTTQDYFKQGMVCKADVLSIEVSLAERRKALLHSTNDQIEAEMTLNRLIGHELFDPLSLEEISGETAPNLSIADLQKHALANRKDRKALLAQIEALEARYRSSKSMHAPKFYLFGGYNYLDSAPPQAQQMNPNKNWVSGGIGMQMPLYEGGKNHAQVEKARAQLAQARAMLEDLDTMVAVEVEKSYITLQETFTNISIEDTTIALAEENMRSIEDRYSQGLVSINDVLKAHEQLSYAKMNKNRAIYRYHGAQAHLITAVGGNL